MKKDNINKRINLRNLIYVVFNMLFFLGINNCATVQVSIPVTHPAEINMNAYKTIAVSNMEGPIGSEVSDGIKESLVESNRFKVIDPAYMNQILRQLRMTGNDLFDQNKRVELGKLIPAAVLIVGHTKATVEKRDYNATATCYQYYQCGNNTCSTPYACTEYWCETTVNAYAGLEVIDVSTGSLLRSKQLPYTKVADSGKTTGGQPACPDASPLLSNAVSYIVSTFMHSIQPWTEMVEVPFMKDDDIPELKIGIEYAQAGQMDGAVKQFEEAVQNAKTNPKLAPEDVARAYWDLGLSYEYSDQFDKAIAAFQSAFQNDPGKEQYLQEENQVKARQRDYQMLKEQENTK